MDILTILILPIHEHGIFFYLFCLQFLSLMSYSFQCTSLSPPWLNLFLDIYSFFFFLINLFIYLFIWLCWVFVSVRGLSPVASSGGHSSSRCTGLSLSWPLLLRSTSPRRTGSVIVAHGSSCSAACGILPDQGSNPCPLHWQADPQPLSHQGSPIYSFDEIINGIVFLIYLSNSL